MANAGVPYLERRSLLLRQENLQVNMGCFMRPCTWSTCGLHSGSPSNSKTNRGSGSARTVRLSCAAPPEEAAGAGAALRPARRLPMAT